MYEHVKEKKNIIFERQFNETVQNGFKTKK